MIKFLKAFWRYVRENTYLLFLQIVGIYSLLSAWLCKDSTWTLTAILVSVFIAEQRIMIYLKSLTKALFEEYDEEKDKDES